MSDKYSGLEAALRSARMTFVSEAEAGDRSIMEGANAYSPEAYPQGWEVVEVEDGGAA